MVQNQKNFATLVPSRFQGVASGLSGQVIIMTIAIDKLTESGCTVEKKDKLCRSRGGESCAFDGAMIVLQPIADTAHLVHGPIACCGNSWEGRGTLSSRGDLHTMGFTTDMSEIDIVYGSEEKLLKAVHRTVDAVKPKAVFVYSTCVSGLTGEDIDAVCKRAEAELGVRVIPVNAPGFVGPKNLGNRIAGEVLLEHVIGTGEPPVMTHTDINLIGEYNIAGDLWLVEPLLEKAGIRVLSRITGNSTFEEITWAHRAKLNVVVCGRALINVARDMESRYGIPYVEVSFFGSTEIAKALRAIGSGLSRLNGSNSLDQIDAVIRYEERELKESLKRYRHLQGKKAVLYTGGVKSWSFISALRDLGIDVVAVGTKKSTFEDEEKMKEILGSGALLEENVAPGNLLKLLKERNADMLIAGGRNQYLAVKEGFPFVDVNQERHIAYAGYSGLVNFAKQICNSMRFYRKGSKFGVLSSELGAKKQHQSKIANPKSEVLIDPLKHSPVIGAALALQGIDGALPIIHGAQGCTFLGKALLTKHFGEPIALAGSKLFVEDVVMGSEEKLEKTIDDFIKKNKPGVIGILSTGLSEVKGDDVDAVVKKFRNRSDTAVVSVRVPDFEGGLETGYARAIEAIIDIIPGRGERVAGSGLSSTLKSINIIGGSHLTPADFTEIREYVESFGFNPVFLPDLSALDGSREGFSPLAAGGTTLSELEKMCDAVFTLAIGVSMTGSARLIGQRFGVPFSVIESLSGLEDTDRFLGLLQRISGRQVPSRYERQRKILVDTMRDAHAYFGGKSVCLALEPDHAVQMSRWLSEMGANVQLAVIPTLSDAADRILAGEVEIGDLFRIEGQFDLLAANSHGESAAKRLRAAHYETGFPVFKSLGYTSRVSVGYRGTLTMIHEVANLLMKNLEKP